MIEKIMISTEKRCQLVDITGEIQKIINKNKIKDGVIHIFCPHTTAAITINENYDPSVQEDITNALEKLIPYRGNYSHTEGNADAHIKAAIIGSSRTLFIENGKLAFGTWQGIFFCEFDGPRTREIWVKIVECRS
ncbi:MAG: secondary thiamine-phosphate synthase enzyme YjbQ [candidate division WOR-3 bacterium]